MASRSGDPSHKGLTASTTSPISPQKEAGPSQTHSPMDAQARRKRRRLSTEVFEDGYDDAMDVDSTKSEIAKSHAESKAKPITVELGGQRALFVQDGKGVSPIASAEDTPGHAKPTATSKPKKGSIARSTNTMDAPGNPNNPSTFISVETVEQKVAAYLGFNNVADLRRLALSYPVLRACRIYETFGSAMRRNTAFDILHNHEADVAAITDPHLSFPIADAQSAPLSPLQLKQNTTAKPWHLAHLLFTLEQDLREVFDPAFTADNKRKVQADESAKFVQAFPTFPLPSMYSIVNVVAPILDPLPNESKLEVFNRCWTLIRYIRYIMQQQRYWPMRFSNGSFDVDAMVDRSHVPVWMQPESNALPALISKPHSIKEADKLPLQRCTLSTCGRCVQFGGQEDVEDVLSSADRIPDATQDTRLLASSEIFRDIIRRQLMVERLKLDLDTLQLHYKVISIGESLHTDVLNATWDAVLELFKNPDHEDLKIQFTPKAADEREARSDEVEKPGG